MSVCPELPDLTALPRATAFVLGRPMLTAHRRPIDGWNSIAKRAEHIVLGSVLLLLVSPLMLLVALAIRLDSRAPALFRQQRLGFDNDVITVLKSRSMRCREGQEAGVPQATRDDARVTRIGRFLRRTGLDALPQLWNVLRGDMSLVGPRPHALAYNQQYAALIDDYPGPAPRPPRHDRLGAGQRGARRDRHARRDAATGRVRCRLYRRLADHARHQDPALDPGLDRPQRLMRLRRACRHPADDHPSRARRPRTSRLRCPCSAVARMILAGGGDPRLNQGSAHPPPGACEMDEAAEVGALRSERVATCPTS